MLKATFLEGTLALAIVPAGPILVKAGESASADPTLPDMEFVRTRRSGKAQVYIPGSSLKGVLRAQCERICRSLDRDGRDPDNDNPPLADNPLGRGDTYAGLSDMNFSSGAYFNKLKSAKAFDALRPAQQTAQIYRRSSFASQIFGNTSLAGRVRFADAYSDDIQPEDIEERNGVAIDRIYGSVAVGPFNYETVVGGTFETRIDFRNLTLAQLGLLGLGLRDLAEGRVGLGFGKSRGLGRVKVTFTALDLYYPTCVLADDRALRNLSGQPVVSAGQIPGIGALCSDAAYADYAFPSNDSAPLPEGLAFEEDELLGIRLRAAGDTQVRAIWRACMGPWKREIGL